MSKKKDSLKVALPQLRFPEFENSKGWAKKKLNELLFETKHRNRKLEYDKNAVLSVSGEHGCVNQIEFLGRSYAGKSVKDYHIVEKGDIVYTKSPLKRNPYGIIKENKGKAGIVSTLYAVYRAKEICHPDFLDHYFSRDYNLNTYLEPLVKKGPKNDMKVNNLDVLSGEIWVPERNEQLKISKFLSSINELIKLELQKLENLRKYKKSLMQQLFPAEGEALPIFRFPEFKNAPEWEEKSLGKVFTRIKTKNAEHNLNCLTISAQDGLVSQLDYFNKKISAKDLTGYYLLQKGDFAYNKSYSQGYPMGAIKRLKFYDKGVVSTLYICFRIHKGYCEDFFEHFFDHGMINSEIAKVAQEGARNHGLLNIGINDFFDSVNVKFPKLKEQQKIADCLSVADDMITAQFEKVETLKDHKKGLMQQLFPATDEATE